MLSRMDKLVYENGNNKGNDKRVQQTSESVNACNGCKKNIRVGCQEHMRQVNVYRQGNRKQKLQ